MKTQKIVSLILAIALVFSVGCVSAFAADDQPLVYDKDDELTLSGLFEANGCDGAIQAKGGAELVINGSDSDVVKGLLGHDASTGKNYSMAVWAHDEGTEVVINGGYYTNDPDPKKKDQADLIYASKGANIVINGGKFECATPQWTLNCNDKTGGTITVKGGKFYQFDPSKANEKVAPKGKTEIVVPAGYSVVEKDGWYEVLSNAKVYDNETKTLTLSGELVANGVDGAIWAKNSSKLTIDGEGTVKALLGTDPSTGKNYSMAVWAQGEGTEVTIEGGYYTNEADPDYPSQADLIYAKAGAKVVINGGTFKCATPQWTLNCHDTLSATITVNGGKFYQFDPSNANEQVAPAGKTEIVLGEDCTVVKNGDWYEVKKVAEEEKASITYDSTSANTDKGALRFVFNVKIPTPTKTYFGAYLLPLDIFKASGVAKAIQVQYDTNIETETSFSADLVQIPAEKFATDIYAIPYIKTANGVETFTGKSASVNSASKAQ